MTHESTAAVKEPYDFGSTLKKNNLMVTPDSIETLWVNITRQCNQACTHCHVGASPGRTEQMSRTVIDACLGALAGDDRILNLDITGGAPELHPDYRYLVTGARNLGKHVITRHNLTIIFDGNPLTQERMDWLPAFLAKQKVEIVASLPHYEREYTDTQRGPGIFQKSIEGLRLLNAVGYGREGTGLILDLMHNAAGPIDPDARVRLEEEYRQALSDRYGIIFNRLFTVTNVPINRFLQRLLDTGGYDDYMAGLVATFNEAAVPGLVCRSLVSVGWDGRLYDCDFNQARGLQIRTQKPMTIFDFDYDKLLRRRIRFGVHCFGCTAGGGGS